MNGRIPRSLGEHRLAIWRQETFRRCASTKKKEARVHQASSKSKMSLWKPPTVATIKSPRCAVSGLGGQPLSYKQGWQRLSRDAEGPFAAAPPASSEEEGLPFLYSNDMPFREFYPLATTKHSRSRQRSALSSQRLPSSKALGYEHAQTMSHARVSASRGVASSRCMKNEGLAPVDCRSRSRSGHPGKAKVEAEAGTSGLPKSKPKRAPSVHRVPWPFAPSEPQRWDDASPARLVIWYTYIDTVAAFFMTHLEPQSPFPR